MSMSLFKILFETGIVLFYRTFAPNF